MNSISSPKKHKHVNMNKYEQSQMSDVLFIYTDGACINNGKPNASAGIGVYFGENDCRNISRKLTGKQTNNAAELTAALEAVYEAANMSIPTVVVTDSEYVMKCINGFGIKCASQQWPSHVPNIGLIKQLYEAKQSLPHISFMHVRAHTSNLDAHSTGNRNADLLARAGAKK